MSSRIIWFGLPTEGGWKVFQFHPERIRNTIRYIERNPLPIGEPIPRWPFVVDYDGWPLHRGHSPNSPYAKALRAAGLYIHEDDDDPRVERQAPNGEERYYMSRTPSLFANDPELPLELPESWRTSLADETSQPYWPALMQFVECERAEHAVYPPADEVFNAFRYTPVESVKVLLLGQDPYPGAGQAHGLCFSVKPGVNLPASLRNIYRELRDDVGAKPVTHGYLKSWATQGVLMLNACLTVRAGAPNSHAGKGWEKFTDAAIRVVNDLPRRVVFLLWGTYARKKAKLIDTARHTIIEGVHPSPLSAYNGFFGSRPFSKVNAALVDAGDTPIDWQLPEDPK